MDWGRFKYRVSFRYTGGMWRGKRVVPKNDYFRYREEEFLAYSDSQILPILCNILKKDGVRTPYVVDVEILEKSLEGDSCQV